MMSFALFLIPKKTKNRKKNPPFAPRTEFIPQKVFPAVGKAFTAKFCKPSKLLTSGWLFTVLSRFHPHGRLGFSLRGKQKNTTHTQIHAHIYMLRQDRLHLLFSLSLHLTPCDRLCSGLSAYLTVRLSFSPFRATFSHHQSHSWWWNVQSAKCVRLCLRYRTPFPSCLRCGKFSLRRAPASSFSFDDCFLLCGASSGDGGGGGSHHLSVRSCWQGSVFLLPAICMQKSVQ